ncbi:hypothetical protein ACH3XX_38135 [Streptomyces scabiei]|nr:hypothetical protein [Streptomyces scabiei]MDX2835420.1 hypothetical protein [Streptomyces scabiei]
MTVGQDADLSPAAVLALADPGEPGRVAVAHGRVVAVLERLEVSPSPL